MNTAVYSPTYSPATLVEVPQTKAVSFSAESTPEQIAALVARGGAIDVRLPDSTEELERDAVEAENAAFRDAVRQGFRFLALKARKPHGEFEHWLQQQGFSVRSVQHRMQAARALLQAPEAIRPQLLGLGQMKLVTLAGVEPEVFADAVQDPAFLEDAAQIGYRELRTRLQQRERRLADSQEEVETLRFTIGELKKASQARYQGGLFPDWVIRCRDESNGMATAMLQRLDALEQLAAEIETNRFGGEAGIGMPVHMEMAAGSLYVQMQAVAARACGLCEKLRGSFAGIALPALGEVPPALLYGEQEIELALQARRLMTQEHEQESRLREQARANARPRGRGRPRKAEQR